MISDKCLAPTQTAVNETNDDKMSDRINHPCVFETERKGEKTHDKALLRCLVDDVFNGREKAI